MRITQTRLDEFEMTLQEAGHDIRVIATNGRYNIEHRYHHRPLNGGHYLSAREAYSWLCGFTQRGDMEAEKQPPVDKVSHPLGKEVLTFLQSQSVMEYDKFTTDWVSEMAEHLQAVMDVARTTDTIYEALEVLWYDANNIIEVMKPQAHGYTFFKALWQILRKRDW